MEKTIFIAAAVLMVVMCAAESQAGGRYGSCGLSSPKSYSSSGYGSIPSFKSYSAPASRNYSHGGEIYLQNGYGKSNGTYVMPHLKTRPDNTPYNNLGAWGK
jgi:hypothetical protein